MIIVLNKNKLKTIMKYIALTVILLCVGVLLIRDINYQPTFNKTQNNTLYTQGNKENSNTIAITCNIDLGWESEYVEKILNSLKKENVKITFNVTGKWAQKNKELLLKIKSQGHEIGNHGYEHLDYSTLTYEQNYKQIETSKIIIENILKEETKFFQAPSGYFNDETIKAASDLGYKSVKWDTDTIDWMNKEEPEVIIQRIKDKCPVENSIILMHPTYASSEAVDDIIKIIKDKNLKPGKLSDIFI